MARVRRVLERTLRLKVNAAKSAVDRPWTRTCLGFTCTTRQSNRRTVSEKALQAFKARCASFRAAHEVGPCGRSCRNSAS